MKQTSKTLIRHGKLQVQKTIRFEFDCNTYRIGVDWEIGSCGWCCETEFRGVSVFPIRDPGYKLVSIDENPDLVAFFFDILGEEDHAKMGSFLLKFNETLRKILPPGTPKHPAISPNFYKYV